MDEIQAGIKSDYQEQLSEEAQRVDVTAPVRVDSVECIERSDAEARCIANVSGALSGKTGINVTIGDDGRYLWEEDAAGIAGLEPTGAAAVGTPGGFGPTEGGDPEAVLESRLEELGLGYAPTEPVPALSGLEAQAAAFTGLDGVGEVVVEFYPSPAEAGQAETDFLSDLARPEGGRGEAVDEYLVYIGTQEPEGLTEAEISEFAAVVAALEMG